MRLGLNDLGNSLILKKQIVKKILIFIMMVIPAIGFAKKSEMPDTISARRAFLEIPSLSFDLLSKERRGDMLIYLDNDSIWKARNAFDGYSYFEEVAPDYLRIRVTPVSTLQIKVFSGKKGDTVMTVYTVENEEGGSGDSEIRFYDTSMNEVKASKYFKIPNLRDFFSLPKGSAVTMKEIEKMMPFYTVQIVASPGSDDITSVLSPEDYMSIEGYDLIKPFKLPGLVFQWDGNKLVSRK